MPGKNKIALFGMGGVGGACAKALLASEADCLELREAVDVPQIDIETLRYKRPFVIMGKEQYDVLGPVHLKNLEQKYGICIVSDAMQFPFPKDELLEMKDKLKDVALEDKPVPPLVNICSSSKGRSHQQKARNMAKKKKAKRRQQKDARRNNRR